MQTIFLKKITIYITMLFFVLIIFTNISCKKNEQKKLDNKTEATLNEDNKKALSRIKIKDYPVLSENSDYAFEYHSVNGNDEETLKENCYSFYSEYWKNKIKDEKEMDKEDPSYEGLKKIKEIINNPEIDVKVKLIQDNIAIINRAAFGIDGYLGLEKIDDIWILHSGKWILFKGSADNLYREAKLLHLNNDEYIDAIVSGGCCDHRELNILIGEKDKILSLRQNVSINGIDELNYKGKCDINLISKSDPEWAEEHKTKPITLKFDCNNNGFVILENQ
jgi:hypothetical protein